MRPAIRRCTVVGPADGLRLAATDRMSQARQLLGKTGEDLACRELERRGYEILARRYRRRGGELDVIARDGDTLVFVEVKTRAGLAFGHAAEAVSVVKRRRIVRLAQEYIVCHRLTGPCRFDVVAIDFHRERPSVSVYQDAFGATA